jgi:hypothetical protein
MDFWKRLVEAGLISGDPTYYSEGRAEAFEYQEALEKAREANPKLFTDIAYEMGLASGDKNYWYEDRGAETQDLFNAILNNPKTGSAGKAADDYTPAEVGTATGVMAGGRTVRVARPGRPDVYAQIYEFPKGSGKYVSFQFDDLAQARAILGNDVPIGSVTESWYKDNANIGGSAANEVAGVEGSWTQFTTDVMDSAARDSGIADPTRLAQYMADPDVQNVLFNSAIGGWSDERQLAELRKTDFYKNTLYPGIENFYSSTGEPEAAWRMYRQNVTTNLVAMGVPKDADGTYNSQLKKMLDGGVDDTTFAEFAPNFIRAAGNETYRNNINQWLGAAGMGTINTFEQFYDVIGGNAPPEIAEIIELAAYSFNAENMGLDLTDDLFREAAAKTDMSEAEIQNRFSDLDRSLFALGSRGLANYGLNTGDIFRAKMGLGSNGRSVEELGAIINKIVTEQGLSDDPSAKFFTNYNQEGAPFKQGLGSSVREGA